MDKEIIIFYSWQSTLPKVTNLNAIRQCLRTASNKIESDFDNIKIILDEATRNTPGSPNIPQTIFNKIDKSDIFICDLSTINQDREGDKKVQNPNVLIELGYAINVLGWNRIIILANENFTVFPDDLPFDVDRHRVTKFKVESKEDNEGIIELSKTLSFAIKLIIEHSPLRPNEINQLSPEQRKRQLDIKNLTNVFSSINLQALDQFY